MSKYLKRYEDGDRMNHWLVALLFVLAGLSGLAFFHPGLFFLSNLFGGGAWTRILHPFIGLAMVLCFVPMFRKLRAHNRMTEADREWRAKMGEMLRGNKEGMPPVGRYNAGQKLVFWAMVWSLLVLIVTGFMFWRPWFAHLLPIDLVRAAALLHAVAATVLILSLIVHVYAAIWVRGTLRAMTRGTVTEAWAKKNHPLWHAEMTGKGGK
ncbi:formate dehydrogenase subunit gamma [Pelomonas sp. SE-A7]|uniref:formate dehydrogenase subunit gamma n=1 Tax=Pelomonas sp. SE-A7 TaxID=3054953 RepID=UPI00259C7C59|nr:formate dehydrogenase subunit gamma [Pelomonas sp. SE-A7]MDM4765875.1 formate dehydrogenase subunit gamma [Pelomonas sp. SE-A7]